MSPFFSDGQLAEYRCVPLLCSFPAVQLRRRLVKMALHNVPRRIIPHFWDLVLLPLRCSPWPQGPPDLPARRPEPCIRLHYLSSGLKNNQALFQNKRGRGYFRTFPSFFLSFFLSFFTTFLLTFLLVWMLRILRIITYGHTIVWAPHECVFAENHQIRVTRINL